ncbi:DUF7282 domain-containing protein [Halosimplex salinum]|uniref:DUF7282 domain-containing protein n=1 Tax=Halosimplex salinum TaxID=1710538 RepID=UPI000F49B4D0|nr:PGF-CTERM sorting domain-containing protein [Halosimplex salinum]
MTTRLNTIGAVFFAMVMVLSVGAGTVAVAGAQTNTDAGDQSAVDSAESVAALENGSAKPLTISWFRDDGDANGPYPVPPNEYDGNESEGIEMFTNAEGDAQLRVDNSTARNPNGQWDMLALHVETDGLEALNPPTEGPDKGLVTQNFVENENWDVEITQTNGDKVLNVEDNQDGFENPPVSQGTERDIPPVMVFADTEEIDDDFTVGSEPDSGIFVWVDPNRATLSQNGEEASFEPGDEFEATFTVDGETDTTTFEMVDGQVRFNDSLSPANTFGTPVGGESTFAGGTDVELVLETEDGETQSTTVEVEGDQTLMDSDSKASAPWGTVEGNFDLSGKENQEFTVTAYAPGPENATVDGEPARDDDDYLDEEHRIQVAEGSGEVRDVIDPEYTIENATIRDSKVMTIAYHNPDHETAFGVGEQVGDGHASGDPSIAKNVDGHGMFDEMWVHFETSDEIFEAIDRSPGRSQVAKFQSSPLSLEVEQVNADGEPKVLNLSRNASGVFIAPDDEESDQRIYNSSEMTGIFFSMLPNDMVLYQDGEAVEPEVGDRFEATLTIETEQGTREESTQFRFVEGETVLANADELELPQSEETEITFNSTQARGTAMGIRLVARNDDGEVIMDENTGEMGLRGLGPQICCDGGMTNPWGSLSATFDTSELPVGTEITASARIVADVPDRDVVTVETINGTIRAPPSGSIEMSDQSGDGESVTVDSLELSDGGFVSVHTGSATGPTIGVSDYLESGEHSDLSIALDEAVSGDTTLYVTAHVDSNNNQEFDFPASDDPLTNDDGSTVAASAAYTLEATPTPTATAEPTDEPTDEPTETPDDGDGTETTEPEPDVETTASGDGPGFGIAAAVVALLAAALVARRRD